MKPPHHRGKRRSPRPTGPRSADAYNPFWRRAKIRAQQYVADSERLRDLFRKAWQKARSADAGPFGKLWDSLLAMIRLIRAFARGEYRVVPTESLVAIVAGVIYFVSPIDLIPDFVPGGYLDDAAVVAWVVGAVKKDLDDFLRWETEQASGPKTSGSAV
jgi:uncharacterized membrane protein YkvA (DUF1232 family)